MFCLKCHVFLLLAVLLALGSGEEAPFKVLVVDGLALGRSVVARAFLEGRSRGRLEVTHAGTAVQEALEAFFAQHGSRNATLAFHLSTFGEGQGAGDHPVVFCQGVMGVDVGAWERVQVTREMVEAADAVLVFAPTEGLTAELQELLGDAQVWLMPQVATPREVYAQALEKMQEWVAQDPVPGVDLAANVVHDLTSHSVADTLVRSMHEWPFTEVDAEYMPGDTEVPFSFLGAKGMRTSASVLVDIKKDAGYDPEAPFDAESPKKCELFVEFSSGFEWEDTKRPADLVERWGKKRASKLELEGDSVAFLVLKLKTSCRNLLGSWQYGLELTLKQQFQLFAREILQFHHLINELA